MLTQTHLLAKEVRARGVKALTNHSFFRWSAQTKWTPQRMGQKTITHVIMCYGIKCYQQIITLYVAL